jgi:hypothetical protein
VLLARNGAPALERASGFADREAQRRNDVETAFKLGSPLSPPAVIARADSQIAPEAPFMGFAMPKRFARFPIASRTRITPSRERVGHPKSFR